MSEYPEFSDPMERPRYTGIPTFMRAPYSEDLGQVDIGLIGIRGPLDDPEVGGFTTLEAQLMIRGLRGLDLIGGDVVEVAPPFDPSGNTALVGANIMFEILCMVAEAVANRRRAAAE